MSKQQVEVIERPEASTAIALLTPMDMLNKALSQGASMEVLERLMALQERWEASQARKAFDEAIANAKAKIPPIARNATGHNSKKYADFSAIARVVDPIISEFGLSYRFRTTQAERISVTCVLSHKSGHSEETTLSGPADKTGSKNEIQAIGSTLTYLQRYSLVQALGLAAAHDDDGKASGAGGVITDDQAEELRKLALDRGSDIEKFLAFISVAAGSPIESIPDIPAAHYALAKYTLNAKKGKASHDHVDH